MAAGHDAVRDEGTELRVTSHQADSLTARSVRTIEGLSSAASIGLVIGLLAASWAVSVALGGAGRVAPHFFYIPIVLAAGRFGFAGVALTAVAAGVAAGPLLPSSVEEGTPQATSDWVSRAIFFLVIGAAMATVIRGLRTALAREAGVADRERELAEQKSAILECVSHEFRTPLTIVSGALQTLRDPALDPDHRGQFLAMAGDATDRLEGLVAVVVAAAGEQSGTTPGVGCEVTLDNLRAGALDCLPGASSTERVRVRVRGPDGRVALQGDPRLLEFALRAVTENALRFSPAQSTVDVGLAAHDSTLVVTVADRGPGLPPAIARAPIAPFRRGQRAEGVHHVGLGLGLYAARAAVVRLGGTLVLGDGPHGGTQVTISIPATPAGS